MVPETNGGKLGCIKIVIGAIISIPAGIVIGIGLLAIISKALAGG